ncbi:MAG: helicase [Deltaproteobacteria bacterium]|nr:helicase [Deltaproteobacteria bacterium]MBU54422.1 helicase [Deltaproteobacteria bacterium]|tara:strand:- start:278 stop:4174 length:3897 start_codon:yes stop_codon:yes gene_type:complete
MEIYRLPAEVRGGREWTELNEKLQRLEVQLNWQDVKIATLPALKALLAGLDMVTHSDALNIEVDLPEEIEERITQILEGETRSGTFEAASPQNVNKVKSQRPDVWKPTAPVEASGPVNPLVDDGQRTGPLNVYQSDPQSLREKLHQAVVSDLLGPKDGPTEEVYESRVRDRYLVGTLAPQKQDIPQEQMDGLSTEGDTDAENGTPDVERPHAASLFPSSIGMSFCVGIEASHIQARVRWGRYEKGPSAHKMAETGEPRRVWKRTQVDELSPPIPLREGRLERWSPSDEQPEVVVRGQVRRYEGVWVVSLFLVNGQKEPHQNRDEAWLFQPELEVASPDGEAIFQRRPYQLSDSKLDPVSSQEQQTLAMLYRHHVEFAVGHGVAVNAESDPDNQALGSKLRTRVIPTYEVPQQEAPDETEIPALRGLVRDMKTLAEAPGGKLVSMLEALPSAYAEWIEAEQKRLDDPAEGLTDYVDVAKKAIGRCSKALKRIYEGLELLRISRDAREAFQFANRAMWQQRIRSIYAESNRRDQPKKIADIDKEQNRTWRTFQLAFILINIAGISRLDHQDRVGGNDATADLLWFPTGGGKTEAYLGLAAYTMAIRRLQGHVNGYSGMEGMAVLMRYTLRLLTLQQFQRAAALICACEDIRRKAFDKGDRRLGEEPFRIGLWVGRKTTPNSTNQSDEAIKQCRSHSGRFSQGFGTGTPAQLTNCPWCGSGLDPARDIRVERFEHGTGRTFLFCSDPLGMCPFTEAKSPKEGIPAVVVDEEIYRRLPTLVIATVDKFAQMPWKGPVQMLFGRVDGYCPRHGFRSPDLDDSDSHPRKGKHPSVKTTARQPLRPPDLIIQDELHLISGPLGSMTGLYETAVDALCRWQDKEGRWIQPKIIASTATVRRASEQIDALFQRKVEIFPPQCTDIRDNFFSRTRPLETHPGRRYVGICAQGKRLKAALIRVYVAYLSAAQQLYDLYGSRADPWMTLVGYFNSIRELAGMRRLVEDDVRSRLRDMDERGLARRTGVLVEELTSRRSSAEIPRLLDRLEIPFAIEVETKKRRKKTKEKDGYHSRPIDVLMATNMISVGVDVKRLGLMVTTGQPKTTAEYIQATSRVGRSFPGIVCTVYNWSRPRDLSHYERFEHYHGTFYQHVEALSLTPFAPRAIDRGLSALLVSLIRLQQDKYNANTAAKNLDRHDPIVVQALEEIAKRAEEVSREAGMAQELKKRLEERLDFWLSQARPTGDGSQLGYKMQQDGQTRGLLRFPGSGPWDYFTCPNSLRNVEPSINLVLDDGGLDNEDIPWAMEEKA